LPLTMFFPVLYLGTIVGVLHFMLLGFLYGNPFIDGLYVSASKNSPAMKRWPSKRLYLIAQFLGTQVEAFILTAVFVWVRSRLEPTAWCSSVFQLAAALAAVRVYPRFWNMWIQTAYPARLLAVEFVNGVIGTVAVVLSLELITRTLGMK